MFTLLMLLALAGQQLDQTQGDIQRGTIAAIERQVCKVGDKASIYAAMNGRSFTHVMDADDLYEIVENTECAQARN